MRKITLLLFLGALFLAGVAVVASPGHALAGVRHELQPLVNTPQEQTFQFYTGFTGIHNNLRFVIGGHPDIKILRIVAMPTGSPEFVFGDASPSDVTVFFALNATTSETGFFEITVVNLTNREVFVQITAVWDGGSFFTAFDAKVEVELAHLANDDEFEVKATFTLGAGSDGLDIPSEIVSLQLTGIGGPFTTTIPAGSFKFHPAQPGKEASPGSQLGGLSRALSMGLS